MVNETSHTLYITQVSYATFKKCGSEHAAIIVPKDIDMGYAREMVRKEYINEMPGLAGALLDVNPLNFTDDNVSLEKRIESLPKGTRIIQ